MSERRQAAWDEAQRRYPTGDRQAGFVAGAAWADDNPDVTPEDLVAAYEEGQRDAVSKGLASPQPRTITRAEFLEALDAHVGLGASGDWVTVEDMLIAAFMAVGIEVRND